MESTPTKILVVGNGESRKRLDLTSLSSQYIIVGCNAIHRDLNVDHLVCYDQRMVLEAIQNTNLTANIYTRKDWYEKFSNKFKQVKKVPDLPYVGKMRYDDPIHWGSGPYAILIAAQQGDDIHIVGFDLWSKDKNVNNLYKDTDNYADSNSHSVDPTYWINQILKVAELYPDKYFTFYNEADWTPPSTWILDNMKYKNIDTLL